MDVFAIMAFCVGSAGMTFGLVSLAKVTQLEAELKKAGVIEDHAR
ncbi:MAG: hypothetical protein AAGH65_08120 [Pseudomonadota bacterium]